jgi:hypothetical protein
MAAGQAVINSGRDDLLPKHIRFPMYKEYINLTWGKLCVKNREKIYDCVATRIRALNPNSWIHAGGWPLGGG